VVDQASANANVRLDLRKPNAGTHVISIDGSQPLVEIVIQNDRAGLYGAWWVGLAACCVRLSRVRGCGQCAWCWGCSARRLSIAHAPVAAALLFPTVFFPVAFLQVASTTPRTRA
jgi:hypothetical protein